MKRRTKERIANGFMWTLLAILFALLVLLAYSPEEFPGWVPFLKLVALGYVGAPSIIGLFWVLGALAEYGFVVVRFGRGRGGESR